MALWVTMMTIDRVCVVVAVVAMAVAVVAVARAKQRQWWSPFQSR